MCEHPPPARTVAPSDGSPRLDSKADEPADFIYVTLESLTTWASKAGPDPGDFLHVEMMPHWFHHAQEVWLNFDVCTATYLDVQTWPHRQLCLEAVLVRGCA